MNGATVGEHGAAVVNAEPIGATVFEAWLDRLTPPQRRGVLATALVDGTLASYPPALELEALGLAPNAASVSAQAQVATQVAGDRPPLVELPDGSIHYTAGGPTYRRVPGSLTFAALGLNAAAIVPLEELPGREAGAWPTVTTPLSAFVDVSALVAASGDVGAAIALARFAVRYLGVRP